MSMCRVFFVTVILAGLMLLYGCGSGSGSTTVLNTVSLSVQPQTNRLESDVLTGNKCTSSVSSGGTYSTDTISVDVVSTAAANALKPSPVTIQRVTLAFTPAISSAPVIATYYDTGFVVPPNGTTTALVHITDKLKYDLVNSYGFQPCSADYFEYNVTMTFEGVEDYSNQSVSFSTQVKVAFADRV